jgi:two-component system, sensor histidine kinase PdtaS
MIPQDDAESGRRLSAAMVESSFTPLLLLNGEMQVLCASASFCKAFDIDARTVPGATLAQLGAGEWALPQLHSLLKATVAGQAEIAAYQMDLKRAGGDMRSLVINAQKLSYGRDEDIRLLVAIQDVTDQRASERQRRMSENQMNDLLREKAVLLQELQHRVANSLQIIASVLMQSAKAAASAEVKGHLFAAHNRVLSVAAIQQHLTAATLGAVALRPYFTACATASARR